MRRGEGQSCFGESLKPTPSLTEYTDSNIILCWPKNVSVYVYHRYQWRIHTLLACPFLIIISLFPYLHFPYVISRPIDLHISSNFTAYTASDEALSHARLYFNQSLVSTYYLPTALVCHMAKTAKTLGLSHHITIHKAIIFF